MQKITKAVIPVAGFGTRFLPTTKAQPKEMMPIVDKPVIQYVVEEAVASGITDIILVTGKGKRAIEDHFDHNSELYNWLVKQGKTKLIVQGIERLTIGNFEGYLTILFGFTAMAISTIRTLIPDLPSWGTIPITIGLLLIVIIVRNKIKR